MNQSTKKFLTWSTLGLGAALSLRAALRWKRSIDLRGRTAVITGGSRGLGLVLARELARERMKLVICARDEEELERARAHLARSGADVLAIPCDVTDAGAVSSMIQTVLDRFGAVDLLINNAGVIEVGPLEVMSQSDFEHTINTHFWGPLHAMTAVIPSMKARGFGRIANISSLGGRIAVPHLMPYCASKFALAGLSEGMRAELLKDGIHVTTVFPGLMRTGSHVNAEFKGRHRIEYALFSISDSIPLFSISAEKAARKIVDAVRHGDPEAVIGLPAKFFVWLHGNFPGFVMDFGGLLNQILPGPGNSQGRTFSGKESASWIAPSILTALGDAASVRNNESAPYLPNGYSRN
jgi:short-subunit dehydrogenase